MDTSRPTTDIAPNAGTLPRTTLSGSLGNPAANRIRVGFVLHVMQVAGAEVLVTQMIDQLSNDIEPTIFCLDSTGALGEKLLTRGIPVVVLGRKPGMDLQVAKKLSAEVYKRRIQVLHAHQYTPFFYSALSRIRYGAKTKILFTEHGRHYPDIVSTKRRLANRWLLQRYAEVSTACCDFSAAALRNNEGFPRAITLRNGVDLTKLCPRGNRSERTVLREKLGMSASTPYAACIARFHPVKDHPTLIRAWKTVVEKLPEAKLLFIGDGEQRSSCEKLSHELGLTDSIEFWGIRDDIPVILQAIDTFALTSVSEAASLTLLEAMASGVPSVLTDVGGNAEHVRHGEEGFLAPRGCSKEIARHLILLLSDGQLANAMGLKARHRVEQNFNLKDVIEEYANYYRALMEI